MIKKKEKLRQHYGIRKTSLGVGSLLLGLTFLGSTASAEEVELLADDLVPVVVEEDLSVSLIEADASFENEGIDLLRAEKDLEQKSLVDVMADDSVVGVYATSETGRVVADTLSVNVQGSTNSTTVADEAKGRDILFIFDTSGSMTTSINGDVAPLKRAVSIYEKVVSSMGDNDYLTIQPIYKNNDATVSPTRRMKKQEASTALSKLSDFLRTAPNDMSWSTSHIDGINPFGLYNSGFEFIDIKTPLTSTVPSETYLDQVHNYSSENTYGIWLVDGWVVDTDEVDTSFSNWIKAHTKTVIPYAFWMKKTERLEQFDRFGYNLTMVNNDNPLTNDQIADSIKEEIGFTTVTTTSFEPLSFKVDVPAGFNVEKIEIIKPDGSKESIPTASTKEFAYTPTVAGTYKLRYVLSGDRPASDVQSTGKILKSGAVAATGSQSVSGETRETKNETTTEPVPFTTERRKANDLPLGSERIVQNGQDGVKTIEWSFEVVNGVAGKKVKVSESVTTQPVNEIVEYGTRESRLETLTESLPYLTDRRPSYALKVGEERVVQKGQNGVKTITFEVESSEGSELSRKQLSEAISTEPVSEIIEYGTHSTKERTETQVVLYEKLIKYTFEMMKDERRIEEGSEGLRTMTYIDHFDGEKLTGSEKISDIITIQPKEEIIWHGTKEIRSRLSLHDIPYKSETRKTFDLMKGQTKVDAGKKGILTRGHEDTLDGSNVVHTKDLSEWVTTEPVTEIVWVGTKSIKNVKDLVVKAHEVITKKDPTMLVGETRLEDGKDEIREQLFEEIYDEDKLVSRTLISEKVTQEGKLGILYVGSKEVKTCTVEKLIAYDTERIEDEKLYVGEEELRQKGETGLDVEEYEEVYIEGQLVTTKLLRTTRKKEPVKEIIAFGTKEHEKMEDCPVEDVQQPQLPATGDVSDALVGASMILSSLAVSGGTILSGKRRRSRIN